MQLYDYRNKIIRLFKNKNIKPSMRAPDAKFDRVKKSEQKFDESIGERVKLERQKSDELKKVIAKNDMTINKELFKQYFQFQSLSAMQKCLSKTKNTQKNKELVQVIESELVDLDNEIKNV